MIVDSKMIQKAKEKLGDRNADLIAELLNVSKWDARNKKGCCPFHTENTPSFIYNPKSYNFHCFGCGANADYIDARVHSGMSYLEACKALFDEAEMDYPMSELHVKTKRSYRYPHEELPLTENCQARKYLNLRGISDKTIDSSPIKQDDNGNIAFEYYDSNSVLTMVKYRPSRKINKENGDIKSWCQKDADTAPILWRMDKINPSQPLTITEGELDTLAVMECGVHNVVSVPLGSQNLHWIEECFDWLEQFESIIICGDNDDAGVKMRKEAISRLGSWRCKYVDIPKVMTDKNGNRRSVKDANEVLFYCGAETLRNMINDATDSEVSSVINVSDIEDINIADVDGVETGIAELDHTLMRLFYGTLTVVSGKPGAGKTSLLSQLICQSMEQDITPFFFSREMPNYLQRSWLYSIMAGPSHMERKETSNGTEYYVVDKDIKDKINRYYSKKWFLYRDDASNKLDDILSSMEDCLRKYGCKFFILDNLMTMDIGGDANSELKKQTETINRLIAFAIKWQAAVVLVCHPRKMAQGEDVGTYDISGTANIINLAHRTLALRRINNEKEGSNYNVRLNIIKDRLFGHANKTIDLYYDVPSRRFYTNNDEFNRSYKWESASGVEHKTTTDPRLNETSENNEEYEDIF